ncbi:putative MFS transporter [Penicillium brasilianum]|uniref:Putative MFS transporter n=1 Tax=Penicillium brasilianum TaxID=104259 RepID=A0A1S9RK46_PENBI|nr:putative MFS transporter [Penicillium brasilianum]
MTFNLISLVVYFSEIKFNRRVVKETVALEAHHSHNPEDRDNSSPKEVLEHLESLDGHAIAVGHGRSSNTQYRPRQTPAEHWTEFLIRHIIFPLGIFPFLIIFWAGLNVAGPGYLLLFWNLTESTVRGASPYNFNPAAAGYAKFAFAVGGILGLLTVGPFFDWVTMKATARNGGKRAAEMRLPALIPYCIITVIEIVIAGLGYQRFWNWPIILVFGYGFSGLCVTAMPTIAVAYAMDYYKPISGETWSSHLTKNTCGFAMSYWVSPLAGYVTPTMVKFARTVGSLLLGIPIYFYGKKIQRLTRNSAVPPTRDNIKDHCIAEC